MRNIIRRLQGKPVVLSPKQEEKMRKAYERAGLDPNAPPPSVRDGWKQSMHMMKDGVAQGRGAGGPQCTKGGCGSGGGGERRGSGSARRSTPAATCSTRAPWTSAGRPPS